MRQFYTQRFFSSYIWLAYVFEAGYSTVVTSVYKKTQQKLVSTNQKALLMLKISWESGPVK